MAAITSAVIGAATAGASIIGASRQQRQARRALNDYERQNLENVYRDMPISMVGTDLMREETARTTAGLTDSARRFGLRGVMSSIPAIQAMNTQANMQTRSYLDDQINQRNRMVAEDQARIRGMQENREFQDLAGIGNLMSVGQQNMQSGINLGLNSLMMGMRGAQGLNFNLGGMFNRGIGTFNEIPGATVIGGDNASAYWGNQGMV